MLYPARSKFQLGCVNGIAFPNAFFNAPLETPFLTNPNKKSGLVRNGRVMKKR